MNTIFNENRYAAILGRINYNYGDKYILNITGRRDGSSRFGPSKRYANFGAVGAAWIFSEESFFKKNFTFLNYGKLRSSYGSTGNYNIGDYQYLATYATLVYPYQGTVGVLPTGLANPDYSWEVNQKFEAAIELNLLKNKITFNAAFFKNRSSNQLVQQPLPGTTGFSSITANLQALVQNTGWELELSNVNVRNKNISWYTSVNLTIARNKLIKFPNLIGSSYENLYSVGSPLSIAKLFSYSGVDSKIGVYQFEHLSDHTPTASPESPNDYIIKDLSVKYYGGVLNSFQLINFNLDFFIQFANIPNYVFIPTYNVPGQFSSGAGNQTIDVLNRWRNSGDNVNVQKFTQAYDLAFSGYNNAVSSDYFITKTSFIRLKNVSLSYRFHNIFQKRIHVNDARIYLQGQNLFTITDFLGFDPETGGALPPLRVLTAGIQLTL